MQSISKRIRVMVVDDSVVARQMIISGLNKSPRIEVVGFAINATDAKNKVHLLKPDVMTCDVQMPGISGIDFLKQFLPQNPLPVVLVSSLNLRVFDALDAGAVDFVRKPDGTTRVTNEDFITTLTQKVIIAATANVRQPRAVRPAPQSIAAPLLGSISGANAIIGLGASTGGTEATLTVMRELPADIPGMVIVQHMSPGFTRMYAERLDRLCKMHVREAVDGDVIERGVALIAPADLQCRVVRGSRGYRLAIGPGDKVSGHRPSVDVLFSSMAEVVRSPMLGIIMTGMGADGARGLLDMRKAGAFTIGQDRESSVVYGMPAVAYDMGAVAVQTSCDNIAAVLLRHLKSL